MWATFQRLSEQSLTSLSCWSPSNWKTFRLGWWKFTFLIHSLYRWLVGSIVGRPPPLHLVLALVLFYTALNSPLQALLDLQPATFVALVGWSLALAATVVFTAHACRLVTDWNLFRCWSALLSRHTPQLLPAVPEYIYLSRTVRPRRSSCFPASLTLVKSSWE